MAAVAGSRTEANLRRAFATAILAWRRYIVLAEQADAEGRHGAALLFRAIAQSRASQAEAHLALLESRNDKASTAYNVRLAIMDNLHACDDAYPAMARIARQEGFSGIADWFEVRAKAGRSHAGRFRRTLQTLL
ncbi:MAG TPA: rubrerythrin family protein [Rhodopila sp.]|jgi:rubrerythrin|nr:rubrerythrin family protein [Rhodopila sp.]